MPKFLVATLVLFLLIIAGGGGSDPAHSAARTIPWNCSDWQAAPAIADAADARVSTILESLAANRGKTLYCAVDQSDTFTKTETWQAGKDRNERDDTIYQGQNGRFRGFLAAQEGYLTDGASGVTGISRDRIFEFPEEQRTRRRTVVIKRQNIPLPDDDGILRTPYGNEGLGHGTESVARTQAESRWDNANTRPLVHWDQWGRDAATAYCESLNQGYNRVVNIRLQDGFTWEYSPDRDNDPNNYIFAARQTRTWTATCQKTKRVRR